VIVMVVRMDTAAAAAAAAGCFGLGHVFFNEPNPFSKPKVKKTNKPTRQRRIQTQRNSRGRRGGGGRKEGRKEGRRKEGRGINFLGLRREVLALKKAFLG